MIVVDSDVTSIAQLGDDGILDEPGLDSQWVKLRTACPRTSQRDRFRQPDLPKRDGQFFRPGAAVERIPVIADLEGEERVGSLQSLPPIRIRSTLENNTDIPIGPADAIGPGDHRYRAPNATLMVCQPLPWRVRRRLIGPVEQVPPVLPFVKDRH